MPQRPPPDRRFGIREGLAAAGLALLGFGGAELLPGLGKLLVGACLLLPVVFPYLTKRR